jgi:fumarate hydratase class II
MAEMLDMVMFQVIGYDTTVALASQAGQLELNVMMPVIAYNLFEMMQIMIASVQVFTERAVHGLTANREKAEGWLALNPIVVTALNPLIGYRQGAALVKEAVERRLKIQDIAIEKAKAGQLQHINGSRLVTVEEVKTALLDLR